MKTFTALIIATTLAGVPQLASAAGTPAIPLVPLLLQHVLPDVLAPTLPVVLNTALPLVIKIADGGVGVAQPVLAGLGLPLPKVLHLVTPVVGGVVGTTLELLPGLGL